MAYASFPQHYDTHSLYCRSGRPGLKLPMLPLGFGTKLAVSIFAENRCVLVLRTFGARYHSPQFRKQLQTALRNRQNEL